MAEEHKQEDEDTGRRTPQDILVLQRTIRALDELPENERNAIVGYLNARYRQ